MSFRPRRPLRVGRLAVSVLFIVLAAVTGGGMAHAMGRHVNPHAAAAPPAHRHPSPAPSPTPRATAAPKPATAAALAPAAEPTAAPPPPVPGPLTPLPGCPPPPPPPPGPPGPGPWHPDHLVPDDQLPVAQPAAPGNAPLWAITGKGVWVWKYHSTEGGDAAAIADRAVRTGLNQIWIRAGDSQNGFYAADELAAIVPAAHARGLSVIAWGFPYLYDPVADAGWTDQALAWRSPSGDRIDGFSPDIETSSEGVALSAQRVAVYLGLVRPARDGRPLVATVYPPTDHWLSAYPYGTMAPYVDAFAPMVYWECRDPGDAAAEAVSRLAAMRPVDVIGQAFSFADDGGRVVQPGTAELDRFMGVARSDGAIGASFWVWQDMNGEEWRAVSAYPWAALQPAPARKLTDQGAPH